jgi:hypothetical protein
MQLAGDLKTAVEFICKGLVALDKQENASVRSSTAPNQEIEGMCNVRSKGK